MNTEFLQSGYEVLKVYSMKNLSINQNTLFTFSFWQNILMLSKMCLANLILSLKTRLCKCLMYKYARRFFNNH